MLILTRKRNESIKIGESVLIKVIQTKPGFVKLGIEAPADVRVLRAELTEFDVAPTCDLQTIEIPVDANHGETYLHFGSEFAAEVEDQMLCVATD